MSDLLRTIRCNTREKRTSKRNESFNQRISWRTASLRMRKLGKLDRRCSDVGYKHNFYKQAAPSSIQFQRSTRELRAALHEIMPTFT